MSARLNGAAIGMVGRPVASDVDPAADPHLVPFERVVEEPGHADRAARAAHDPRGVLQVESRVSIFSSSATGAIAMQLPATR